MTIPPLPGSLGFTGEGAFDTAVDKTEMSLDLSSFLKLMEGLAGSLGGSGVDTGLDPDDFKLDAVTDGLVMYMRFPFLADKLPEGKDWVKVDLRQAASQVPGLELDQFLQFANNGPHSTLAYLKAVSGAIETVGVDELRGVSTTHYRTHVDLAKYATAGARGAARAAELDARRARRADRAADDPRRRVGRRGRSRPQARDGDDDDRARDVSRPPQRR